MSNRPPNWERRTPVNPALVAATAQWLAGHAYDWSCSPLRVFSSNRPEDWLIAACLEDAPSPFVRDLLTAMKGMSVTARGHLIDRAQAEATRMERGR